MEKESGERKPPRRLALRQIYRFLTKISVPPPDGDLHKKFLNARKLKFVYSLRYARK